MKHEDIESICQKHFPQLKFYPELLPVIEEAWDAGASNALKTLASALKKFSPVAVEIILERIAVQQKGYEEFVAFLRQP